MVFPFEIDKNKWDEDILKILLIDRATNSNIIWGTDDYEYLGEKYNSYHPILIESITGEKSNIIKPRILKSKENQFVRIKNKAEVFTPSWVCNAQNNLIDNSWFDRDNVFNTENNKFWITNEKKIKFSNDKKNLGRPMLTKEGLRLHVEKHHI